MTIEQMRIRLKHYNRWPKWEQRVDEMHDMQVYAIYKRLEERGEFEAQAARERKKQQLEGKQLSLFDLYDISEVSCPSSNTTTSTQCE